MRSAFVKSQSLLFRVTNLIVSSAIAFSIGFVMMAAGGVNGPVSGFISELILFPVMYIDKKLTVLRLQNNGSFRNVIRRQFGLPPKY